jgi:hypothetical protein
LSGSRVANTDAAGVATFSDLTLTGLTIQPVQIRFFRELNETADPGIAQVNTSTITVQPGVPANILADGETIHPTNADGTQSLSVRVLDSSGNLVPSAPVFFEVRQGSCGLGASIGSTNAAGVATVQTTVGAALASCTVRARFPGEFSEELPGPNVRHRVFRAPEETYVWVGRVSSDWHTPENWLGRVPAASEVDVFMGGAAEWHASVQSPVPTLRSLYVESNFWLNLNFQNLTVTGDVASDGTIGFSGTLTMASTSGSSVRGNISANLQLAPGSGGCRNYTIAGALTASSLTLSCPLAVDQDLVVTNALQVLSNGGLLTQTRGTISVGGTAIFRGRAQLHAGLLELGGSFIHDGNGDNEVFQADTGHVTRFIGDTRDLSHEIQWNVLALNDASHFGVLEISTTGTSGVAMSWNPILDISALSLGAHRILLQREAVLTIPALFTINLLAGGDEQLPGPPEAAYLDIADGGVMWLQALVPGLAFPLAICEGDRQLANENRGPLRCILTPQ